MSDRFVLLTATLSGEKRSVVLPREVWETEIALIVRKYTKDSTGVVQFTSDADMVAASVEVSREPNSSERIERKVRDENNLQGHWQTNQ